MWEGREWVHKQLHVYVMSVFIENHEYLLITSLDPTPYVWFFVLRLEKPGCCCLHALLYCHPSAYKCLSIAARVVSLLSLGSPNDISAA